jgi:hypothetical protein
LSAKKSILLRLSPELWEELNRLAAQEFRSLNGQIEYLLHHAVRAQNRSPHSTRPKESPSATHKNEGAGSEGGP